MKTRRLWEMLVPANVPPRDGITSWRRAVCEVAGGMTNITQEAPHTGVWVSPQGEMAEERFFVVRVGCSREEMMRVAAITRDHFGQHSVAYWLVSDEFRRTAWDEEKKRAARRRP